MRFALAFADGLICGPDLMRVLETAGNSGFERRRRPRVLVSWTVHFCAATSRVEGRTSNVSSEGLYCLMGAPFTVGSVIDYVLTIPTVDADRRPELVLLQGQAE